jgi:imidazolonepropionase-like amidohydrolase
VRDAVVVVSHGRIVAAGPRASVTIPPTAHRVEVAGKTIIPGLWDMHAHVMQVEWAPVYLAAGVITVRDMGNEVDFEIPFRAALREGRAIGPSLLLAGLVDGPGPDAFGDVTAATPDEARAVTQRYHDLGFEQLKLYSLLKPDVVAALTAEAHRLGMTVTGHVPNSLTILSAVDSGMDHIAHMPIRGEAGSDSVRAIVAHLRERGTVIDPTASWGELLQHSTAEPVAHFQPGVSHLPPVLGQRITAMGVRTIDTATAHARLARTLGVIRALHDAGVPVVAGTDEGVPGFSVYREVELYAAAGFSPIEALRAATAVSARAMRLDGEVGTIEPGKRADLVVLDKNPLDAIGNVRTVRLVMKNGTLYRSADVWMAAGFR